MTFGKKKYVNKVVSLIFVASFVLKVDFVSFVNHIINWFIILGTGAVF